MAKSLSPVRNPPMPGSPPPSYIERVTPNLKHKSLCGACSRGRECNSDRGKQCPFATGEGYNWSNHARTGKPSFTSAIRVPNSGFPAAKDIQVQSVGEIKVREDACTTGKTLPAKTPRYTQNRAVS
eukprot:354171-Pyramimonas_sp.AAC.2